MTAYERTIRSRARQRFTSAALLPLVSVLLLTACREEPADPVRPTPPPADATPTGDQPSMTQENGDQAAVPAPAPTEPRRLPRHWFETDVTQWVGKRWNELDLVNYLRETPDVPEQGEVFLIYYSRTCDHCEQMFRRDFARSADLAGKVIAIEIPESTSVMTAANAWAMPAVQIRQSLQLPMETNWIITAPLTVRIVDGEVRCAEEGDHKSCMNL